MVSKSIFLFLSLFAISVRSQQQTWTWISGSNIINQFGDYGTQGIPSSSNIPGARNGPVSWSDSNNNILWLFGGNGFAGTAGTGKRMNDKLFVAISLYLLCFRLFE